MPSLQTNPTFQDAWLIATQLPPEQRTTLAQELLRRSDAQRTNHPARKSRRAGSQVSVVLVALEQFATAEQLRLEELLARNSEGLLSSQERGDLTKLVDRYEQIMLANSEALLRATHPMLFDSKRRLVSARAKRVSQRGRTVA